MYARVLAMDGVFFRVDGCVTNEDGSTANIFSDLETIMSSSDVSEEQGALRDQAESYNDHAEARVASAVAELNARLADALTRLEDARQGQVVDHLVLDDVLKREQERASEFEALNGDGGIDSAEAQRFEREQSELMERIDALLGDG